MVRQAHHPESGRRANPNNPNSKFQFFTRKEKEAEWLKLGRLTGQQIAGGQWQVDAANLEVPNVKRLVR